MVKTGRLLRLPDGTLREEGYCVRYPINPGITYGYATYTHVYLRTPKMVRLAEKYLPGYDPHCDALVYASAAVEQPFRRLEDAVAAALRLGGTVEEWW